MLVIHLLNKCENHILSSKVLFRIENEIHIGVLGSQINKDKFKN